MSNPKKPNLPPAPEQWSLLKRRYRSLRRFMGLLALEKTRTPMGDMVSTPYALLAQNLLEWNRRLKSRGAGGVMAEGEIDLRSLEAQAEYCEEIGRQASCRVLKQAKDSIRELERENAQLRSELELMGSWLYSPAQTKKGNHMIDIKDRKAAVLAALYNHSKPQGMGFLHYIQGDMTIEDAAKLLQDQTYFDYLHGRVMKVNLYGDELDPWLYDRDNGQGAAQRAIDSII